MIGIIDIDLCNLRSVANAVSAVGHDFKMIAGPRDLRDVTHLILPGVGSYSVAIANLRQRELFEPVRAFAVSGKPLLGICLGMQLLSSFGAEGGASQGLDLVPGRVVRFETSKVPIIPHVGWNELRLLRSHPVFTKVKSGIDFYYVHSFHFVCNDPTGVLGQFEYGGGRYTGAVSHGSVLGVQFHPEKSQSNGLRLIENFCDWNGQC